MTAPTPTLHQLPVVPPRPPKSPARDLLAGPVPAIPPRPVNKRIERSRSPNPDRFAESPFKGGIIIKSPKISPSGSNGEYGDPIDRCGSVPLPSVGQEGMEYSALTQQLTRDQEATSRSASPEQTRTVGEDIKLHAPKPSLPAESAKQRVMGVTRTDSERAASFGIGKPANADERSASRDSGKKPSLGFSTASEQAHHTDEGHGIPEIGQRVPMNPHLGDVQAPSPAPGPEVQGKNHNRKLSSRGLPPGSYGMHGHGVAPQDELEKAYYKKRPDMLEREHHTPLHDRPNHFAMSRDDLNKLVRDTASRASGLASPEHRATPNDEVAFQASEEYATRITSPRPTLMISEDGAASAEILARASSAQDENKPIHVDDPKHPEYYSYGVEQSPIDNVEHEYNAPILASDEVEKAPKGRVQHPAVRPLLERNDSSYDGTSRPTSRPSSRPTSIYNSLQTIEFDHTPLEDVREYEPLFPEAAAKKAEEKRGRTEECKARHYFPSKDVWEDAPTSVHYTAEVSTPDTTEESRRKSSSHHEHRPITPAQAFALHQEELAEKEANGKKHNFLPIFEAKPTWIGHQTRLKGGKSGAGHRFPSRDVWEDTPESLLHEAELSESPKDEQTPEIPEQTPEIPEQTPEAPERPAKKSPELLVQPPAIPERPKSRQGSGDDAAKSQPPASDKPKPLVPARPVKKLSGDSKDGEFSKPKPPVPSRPAGGKIAALQAGFMSDLNKRLQLGPQAPKKEEAEQDDDAEEKEKALLPDARKGRARGPQRRAPTRSPAPAAAAASEEHAKEASSPALTFSLPQTIWNINPDDGDIVVALESRETVSEEVPAAETESEQPPPTESEKAKESEESQKIEVKEEPPKAEAVQKEQQVVEQQEPEPPAKPEEPKEPEVSKESKDVKKQEAEEIKEPEELVKEETLAANTAGETILEAKVEQKEDDKEIELVEVKDEVKA